MEHLIDDLLCFQRAREAGESRCAESAAHVTSSLRGNAYGKFVAAWHADGFDGDAIGVLQEVLAGTVLGDLLRHLGGGAKGESLGKLLAKGLWKVCHLIKRTYVLFKNPFNELFGSKRRLAHLGDKLTDFVLSEISYI